MTTKLSEKQMHAMAVSRGVCPGFEPKSEKPRKKRNNEESRMQKEVVRWWDLVGSQKFKVPSILLFAVPNGAQRSAISGAILKAEGLRVGCPDLVLAVPKIYEQDQYMQTQFGSLFIEMKTATGRLSPEQEVFHERLAEHGYRVAVCRSAQEAVDVIEEYLT